MSTLLCITFIVFHEDVLKKSLFFTLHKNIIDHTYQHGLIKSKQMKKLWKVLKTVYIVCTFPPDYACVFELTPALRNFSFHKKTSKSFCTMLGKNEWYVSIGSGYILYHDFWSYNLQYFISEKITYNIYVRLTWIHGSWVSDYNIFV